MEISAINVWPARSNAGLGLLQGLGLDAEQIVAGYDSKAQKMVQGWLRESRVHRVSLASRGLLRALDKQSAPDAETLRNVRAFAADAGAAAGPGLQRWLADQRG